MKRSGLLGANGHCATCGAEWDGRNAVGLAAQHAYRTGHSVYAEQIIGTHWEGEKR